MTDQQWDLLKKTINGEVVKPLPVGFIIDCPWLPNWYGIKIATQFPIGLKHQRQSQMTGRWQPGL